MQLDTKGIDLFEGLSGLLKIYPSEVKVADLTVFYGLVKIIKYAIIKTYEIFLNQKDHMYILWE